MILASDRELERLQLAGVVVDCAFCANAITNRADHSTADCSALHVQVHKNVPRICSAFVERK